MACLRRERCADVAKRVRSVAAACVVASGLLVGGAGATLALAEPDSGQTGPTHGGATAPTSSATLGATATQEIAASDGSGTAATASAPKPPSQVGDGRNGLPSEEPKATSTEAPPSKVLPPDPKVPEQTGWTSAGEPVPHLSVRLAEVPVLVATPTETTEPSPTPAPPKGDADSPNEMEHHPGWGWPSSWPSSWPWCWPAPPPGQPPGHGGGSGGGGGGGTRPPSGLPKPPPLMQLPIPREVAPTLPVISVDPNVDAVTGVATAAAQLPFVPITLPVVVAPLGAGSAGPRVGTPSAPRTSGTPGNQGRPSQQGGRQNPPAYGASGGVTPPSFRAGYGEYLRTARMGQIAAVAVPGVVGILIITGAGGVVGYRQARAGHAVRANGTARFVA